MIYSIFHYKELHGDVGQEWMKIIGAAGSYLTHRTATIEIPGHVTASILFGVHHYNLLPPTWMGSRDVTESYFIGRERGTKKTEQRKIFNKSTTRSKKKSSQKMLERVQIVEDTAHHLIPDFVPVSSNEEKAMRTKSGDLLWYRKGSRSLTGRGGPQPYSTYEAFLHNRLNKNWIKRRVK